MTFVKGGPPGPGRPKGFPNKESLEKRLLKAELKAIRGKEMPLDYMLRKMRNPAESPESQFAAAKAAAPYCHPQLQAVAHRLLDADGKPIAPMVNLRVLEPPPEPEVPKLTVEGPKDGDIVQ